MEQTVNNGSNSQLEYTNGKEKRKRILKLAVIGFVVAGAVITYYLYLSSHEVYVEKSQVLATEINLGSVSGGKLEHMFVNPGDEVKENQNVAQVGNEIVKAKVAGVITKADQNIGKVYAPGETVVTMIEPEDLRVVAQTEEDKGLKDIKVGEKAYFTVDAFGSKKFWGVVDEVSPTYREGDVVFDISSQRQVNEFNVKIRYDVNQYPELKNGMSAKAWIIKD